MLCTTVVEKYQRHSVEGGRALSLRRIFEGERLIILSLKGCSSGKENKMSLGEIK